MGVPKVCEGVQRGVISQTQADGSLCASSGKVGCGRLSGLFAGLWAIFPVFLWLHWCGCWLVLPAVVLCSVASLVKHFLALVSGPGMPVGANSKACEDHRQRGATTAEVIFVLRHHTVNSFLPWVWMLSCTPCYLSYSTRNWYARVAPALFLNRFTRPSALCCHYIIAPSICTLTFPHLVSPHLRLQDGVAMLSSL
jgi:hypothetical protein